jgi:tetratricopeptide (TPR) repeat protein
MSKAEKFFQMATTLPFEEEKDERDEGAVPEIVHVAKLRDAGNMQDAIDYGNSLIKMYPSFDLLPFMVAYIYYQKDFPQEALQVAVHAIPQCKRRYRLYAVAGLAEFKRGNLAEALVWWSRSVIAQCTVVDFQESEPFLFLAHAAELVGGKRESAMLFTMTDAIEQSGLRLSEAEIAGLSALNSSWVRQPLLTVLKHIDDKYLHNGR